MSYAVLLGCVVAAAAAAGYAAGLAVVGLRARWQPPETAAGGPAFALRVLPGALALVASLALALPAFVRFEPEQTEARPGIVGMVVTAAGLALVLGALARGLAAWRATVRLVREWRRGSEPFPITAPAPAFVLDHAFPVVAVVGILRPRLFLARSVVAALTPEELRAVLAHEAGHLAARDNLKRLALRFMPTLGWSRLAGRLEERWEAEAEARADGAAGPEAALELASALLKTARLAPPGTRLTLPVAAFHSGHGVAERVQGLLEAPGTEESRRWSPARLWLPLTALAIAAAAAVLPLVHDLSEFLIHLP